MSDTDSEEPRKPSRLRKIIRKRAVIEAVGFSDTHLQRLEQRGLFPRRIKIGGGTAKSSAAGYFEDEVQDWIASRPHSITHHDAPAEPAPVPKHWARKKSKGKKKVKKRGADVALMP